MGLNDFTVMNRLRALPIFVLADTSGSMQGEKILALNNALREMAASLRSADDIRGEFQMAVITFGGEGARVDQPLQDVASLKLHELCAGGKTPMGAAFDLVCDLVNDTSVVPSTAYTPAIVLVSDGIPTDIGVSSPGFNDYLNWTPLKRLQDTNERVSKCLRLAMGIGDDAQSEMLKAFVNNEGMPVFQAKNAADIQAFFKWVTMSSISRMRSINPDNTDSILPDDLMDIDLPY